VLIREIRGYFFFICGYLRKSAATFFKPIAYL
jgi:hypothetical protein